MPDKENIIKITATKNKSIVNYLLKSFDGDMFTFKNNLNWDRYWYYSYMIHVNDSFIFYDRYFDTIHQFDAKEIV